MLTLHNFSQRFRYDQYPELNMAALNNDQGHLLDRWYENNQPFGLWRCDLLDSDGNDVLYIIAVPEDEYLQDTPAPKDQIIARAQQHRQSVIYDYEITNWFIDRYAIPGPDHRSSLNVYGVPELTQQQIDTLLHLNPLHRHNWNNSGECEICETYNEDYDTRELE